MFSGMRRKGLANVIGTVFIALLSIVSAGLVAFIINGVINSGSEELSPGLFCIDMQTNEPFEIVLACKDFSEGELEISIRRALHGEKIESINFVIGSSEGESTTWIAGDGCESCELPSIGGAETYFFPFENLE